MKLLNRSGNFFVEKEFDAQGRVSRVTNPFRSGETKQWTTNVYDEASRIKEVILPDTSKVLTAYGVSTTAPVGVTKTITDQAGKKRQGLSEKNNGARPAILRYSNIGKLVRNISA